MMYSVGDKAYKEGSFGKDLSFLNQHIETVVLKEGERQIIVSSEFQGRVFSSTSKGLDGASYGWFDKRVIASDSAKQSISKVGGVSRIWFGPDQGENNVFGVLDQDTQEVVRVIPIDLEKLPFLILEKSETSIIIGNKMHIKNLKGFDFYIDVKRKIQLLLTKEIESNLKISLNDSIDFVAYSAETSMTNIGNENWTKEQGLISLWELGCMQPTPKTTVVIPLKGKLDAANSYFTPLDDTRIKIKDNVLFYRADANYFNKIGTLPENSRSYFGSYSPELNLLTVVRYNFIGEEDYVNAIPDNTDPYKGDVINVFNDGKLGDAGPFGPFYELETSSPARALKVGEDIAHTHETYHFEGSKEALNTISDAVFGVDLETVENTLP